MAEGFGVFGKLPSQGDFVTWSLGPSFVQPWDAWLQRGMVAAKAALGPRYEACYYSAPIWRFTLPDGAAGPAPVLGVLVPSVDRVGRQFPLTLAAILPAGTPPIAGHLRAGAVFEGLETLALDILDGEMDRAAIGARLAALPHPAVEPGRWVELGGGLVLALRSDEAGAVPDLAAALMRGPAPAQSVWSTHIPDATRALATPGLPPVTLLTQLLDPADPLWAATEPA